MRPSPEYVNYRLRPAKQIERKMLIEAFTRVGDFANLRSYRYVGFGSIYFADMAMIHKALGIRDIVSIEKKEGLRDRCEFNKPFSCIQLEIGDSKTVLPRLSWKKRTILWLDYDQALTTNDLQDIGLFCTEAQSGSVIVVTANVHPKKDRNIENLIKDIDESRVPEGLSEVQLQENWGLAKVIRRVVRNEIEESLNDRNGPTDSDDRFVFEQLFNFHYQDGAKMLTVGGIIFDEGMRGNFLKCRFDSLDFVRTGEEPFVLEVPQFTYRELAHLDRQLPVRAGETLTISGIRKQDLERYSRIYRYYPTFAETSL